MKSGKQTSSKGLKICSVIAGLLLIALLVVLIVLCLTVLRPIEPEIVAQIVKLKELQWQTSPSPNVSVSLGLIVTIYNPNHGSFRYENSTTYLRYYGDVVATATIQGGEIPPLRTGNITTIIGVDGETLKAVGNFSSDLNTGSLYLASSATLVGKVNIFGLFRIRVTGFTGCEVGVFLKDRVASPSCTYQMNF
ncbi:hypothetical protein Droror1_Dr00010554 [Drosera rotundifolia]